MMDIRKELGEALVQDFWRQSLETHDFVPHFVVDRALLQIPEVHLLQFLHTATQDVLVELSGLLERRGQVVKVRDVGALLVVN